MHSVPVSAGSKINIVVQSIKNLLTFDVFPVPCFLKRIHCIWIFYLNCVFGCCKDVSLVDHLRWQSCWIVTQWQCMTAGRSGCLSRNRGFSGCTCQQWDMYCFKYSWENEKGIDFKKCCEAKWKLYLQYFIFCCLKKSKQWKSGVTHFTRATQ